MKSKEIIQCLKELLRQNLITDQCQKEALINAIRDLEKKSNYENKIRLLETLLRLIGIGSNFF